MRAAADLPVLSAAGLLPWRKLAECLCCLRVVLSSVQNEFRVVSGVVWGVLRRRNCYVLCEVVASASAVVVVTPRGGVSLVLLLAKICLLFMLVALSL